jgi:steroid 5-alpha reductase family enzyme
MKNFLIFLLFVIISFCFSGIAILLFGVSLTNADPFAVTALCALGFALGSFIFGIITRDNSWVDRLWSTLPVVFVWYYAYRGGFTPVLCIITALVTFWGARLTFNFARKGGYTGEEDYRWSFLRGKITNPFLWQIFSLFFISAYQIGMFLLFTWPVYSLVKTGYAASALFYVFAAAAFVCVCIEIAADQMQWNFHAAKRAEKEGKSIPEKYVKDVKNGFYSQGLFRFSRHPNYFGELGFWCAVWLMAFVLIGDFVVSGFFGPVMLIILFIPSAILTENITGSKYPNYKDYKKVTSQIIPWFPGKSNT